MDLHRRQVLAVFLSLGMGRVHRLFAQSRADVTVAAITLNRAAARQLLVDVHASSDSINADTVGPFLQRDYELRLELCTIFDTVPDSSVDDYVLPEERPLVNEMREQGIQPVPDPADIRQETVLFASSPPDCEETLTTVVVDVVVGVLGLTEATAAIRTLVQDIPELREAVDHIARSAELRDYAQLFDAVMHLLTLLKRLPFQRYVEVLGQAEARRIRNQLLVRLGLRLVPILGWTYVSIKAALVVSSNYDRLLAAASC